MSKHLKYQKLPWGGYVVRNSHVWKRVINEHFYTTLPPKETPREYPCVVWFNGRELFQASLPKTLDAGLRRLVELEEQGWRLYVPAAPNPTEAEIERDRDICKDLASICKLQRWAGVEMRERYKKFWLHERKLKGLFYIELNVAAIEWDMRPPNIDADGCIRVWMHELKEVAPTFEGLSMWFGCGIATYMHGNRPVATWEAIKCVGSLRPGGTTAKFYPELQYVRAPLLDTLQDICRMLQHVDIEFVDSPQEDK
jgi:hypothetical protein